MRGKCDVCVDIYNVYAVLKVSVSVRITNVCADYYSGCVINMALKWFVNRRLWHVFHVCVEYKHNCVRNIKHVCVIFFNVLGIINNEYDRTLDVFVETSGANVQKWIEYVIFGLGGSPRPGLRLCLRLWYLTLTITLTAKWKTTKVEGKSTLFLLVLLFGPHHPIMFSQISLWVGVSVFAHTHPHRYLRNDDRVVGPK